MSKFIQPDNSVLDIKDPLNLHFSISEIFHSLQGEGVRAGERCVFIRLQGCSLRCSWCDTAYALDHKKGGFDMKGEEILSKIEEFDCNFIEFTGGEPLEQVNIYPLMTFLCDKGYTVAIETGGHINTQFVDTRVIKIIDMKCPDSKMSSLNNYDNLLLINAQDEVKFVLASRTDYLWAKQIVEQYQLINSCKAVLFSCVFNQLAFVDLAEWILEDRLDVKMQLQMHKFIWDPMARGV
jgi:7-carboxy-7-deazaguanine synthase